MTISFHLECATADEVLHDLQRLFPHLMSGATPGLPPMQEQPKREPEPVKSGEIIEPAPKKTRGKKDKEPETIEAAPLPDASTVVDTPSASTPSEAETSTTSASSAPSVPELDDVRAKLKTLGATDGLGHDKVFELLGKYGAKNASTVPEDKRAALIAEIDELLS